ncbi:MAG: DUF2162 domain-containing protein [Desulfobacteraceae bacterium]|nr:DUF2162 domain-containing protein [Desulfobacteraceae bacterium]
MLKQLWITGVFTGFLIFGIKAGLGLSSYLYNKSTKVKKKLLFLFCAIFTYLLLFLGLFFVITCFNLLDYLDQFLNLLKYGMLLHIIIAFGLFFWGGKLLMQRDDVSTQHTLRYGFMLLFPCPVCATVILLNLTLAYSLFSLSPAFVTLALFSIFMGIILLTISIVFPFRHIIMSSNSFLGLSMTFVALYFLFTIIIAPIYPEIKASYAMALSNNPFSNMSLFFTGILLIAVFFLSGYGFFKAYFSKFTQGKQK